jgi:hypothetical protein
LKKKKKKKKEEEEEEERRRRRRSLIAKTRLLYFKRTQSSVVTGLLPGHNTLRRYFHLKGLTNIPLYKRCGAEGETSAHIL